MDWKELGLIGDSPQMQGVRDEIVCVAEDDLTVLITGPTGSGKENVANAIHQLGHRKDGPFESVRCFNGASESAQSQLFGHVRGAFTGAESDRLGAFRSAEKGTLFIDEVQNAPPEVQALLLSVLESSRPPRRMKPYGGDEEAELDVRVIVGTNEDLDECVSSGRFREDLLYRVRVLSISVPSFRERGRDSVLLARHFVENETQRSGKRIDGLSKKSEADILRYDWPGNVRQLKSVIEDAVAHFPRDSKGALDVVVPEVGSGHQQYPRGGRKEDILQALEETWDLGATANKLRIKYDALRKQIRKFSKDDPAFEGRVKELTRKHERHSRKPTTGDVPTREPAGASPPCYEPPMSDTAADIQWQVIREMVDRGLASQEQRLPVLHALGILGAVAFEMTSQAIFVNLANLQELDDLFKQVVERLQRSGIDAAEDEIQTALNAIGATEELLPHVFGERKGARLRWLRWHDPRHQEWFSAYWLSRFATADDVGEFSKRLPAIDYTKNRIFHGVWRFLCEMDEEARDNDYWLEAIAPIYRRSDAGGETMGRNCELIYLAWETLERLSNSGNVKAKEILAGFLGEFEELCQRGDETGRLANDLRNSLMEIQPGGYRMGSEGSTPEAGEQFAAMIESALQTRFRDPQDAARGLLSRFWHPVAWDQCEHESAITRFAGYIKQRDKDSIFRALADLEEPLKSKQKVAGFRLGCWPVTNEFYRLFDPEHGKSLAPWCDKRTYNKRSGDDKSPVIFVSWYCAWVFCRWAHWGGLSCRLPTEVEWEYACRAGKRGKWCFDGDETGLKDFAWYSDDPDNPKTRTDCVGQRQKNAFGLYDMHGNVWEWCADEDPGEYAGKKCWEWIGPVRTLRGGSWGIWANACRSACRHVMPATSCEPFYGFRVARDSDADH